jgi:hypothetical protein
MENSVYEINKGINKPIEFKGLKAQYIWYLGAGVMALMILFAALYILGINSFICLGVIGIAGVFVVMKVYALSNKYGEHGMTKAIAKRSLPKGIKSNSRELYFEESLKRITRKKGSIVDYVRPIPKQQRHRTLNSRSPEA